MCWSRQPQSPHRLIYQTAPLTAPVHVSGIPSVSLRIVVRSAGGDRQRDARRHTKRRRAGRSSRAAGPIRRIASRSSARRRVVPGTAYTIAFELQPHDYIFQAGSRIGLVLLSSDRLFTLRPPAGTRLTRPTPRESTLRLPVVGGGEGVRGGDAVRRLGHRAG